MNKQRLSILIASGLGALATFLPWAKVLGLSVSGTAGDGWLTLILFAIPIILSLKGEKTSRIQGKELYGAIVPAALAALIGIWKITDFNSATAGAEMMGVSVASIGVGLYLLVLAGIAVPVVAFVIKD